MKLCDYGCEKEATYFFKYSKKWCCCDSHNKCPNVKLKNSLSTIGRKHSNETKKKMSEQRKGNKNAMYGKKHTEGTKNKISKKMKGNKGYWLGKKRSDDTKIKISIRKTGIKLTEETKIKMSISTSGPNHPNWKGGISVEPYCDVWNDIKYKESIKERDGCVCLNPYCFGNSKTLCIHHIDYIKKNCHPYNLITLCISCNAMANKDREWYNYWYKTIIENRYVRGN